MPRDNALSDENRPPDGPAAENGPTIAPDIGLVDRFARVEDDRDDELSTVVVDLALFTSKDLESADVCFAFKFDFGLSVTLAVARIFLLSYSGRLISRKAS